MSCMLRIPEGFEPDEVSKDALDLELARSGVWIAEVSNADFGDTPKQVADAVAFLSLHCESLRGLPPGSCLDFGIAARDVAAQTEYFPAELLRLAGGLGLDLVVTIYEVD